MGILEGAMHARKTAEPQLLHNYLDDDTWFGDTAGTALLGAVTFRMAVLSPANVGESHIFFAEECWRAIVLSTETATGTVGPTANPLDWKNRKPSYEGSSEGHSFAVMLF